MNELLNACDKCKNDGGDRDNDDGGDDDTYLIARASVLATADSRLQNSCAWSRNGAWPCDETGVPSLLFGLLQNGRRRDGRNGGLVLRAFWALREHGELIPHGNGLGVHSAGAPRMTCSSLHSRTSRTYPGDGSLGTWAS